MKHYPLPIQEKVKEVIFSLREDNFFEKEEVKASPPSKTLSTSGSGGGGGVLPPASIAAATDCTFTEASDEPIANILFVGYSTLIFMTTTL